MGVAPGSAVRLVTPEIPRLDGAAATVERVESWGCHLLTAAAATGRFRAAWHEMEIDGPAPGLNGHARSAGYTGDACSACGGARMTRAGACQVCADCGASSGCG